MVVIRGGLLVVYSLDKKVTPHAVRAKEQLLHDFQKMIRSQGIESLWPKP